MSNYSERMSANNDLMDPDWKPEIKYNKIKIIENIKELFDSLYDLNELLNKHDLIDKGMSLSVTMSFEKWDRIKNALNKNKCGN